MRLAISVGLLTLLALAVPAAACAQIPTFNVSDAASVVEGGTGTDTMVSFTITRSGDTAGTSTIDFGSCCGTATDGVSGDYTFGQGGQYTFSGGQTSKTVTFPVHGDAAIEYDETFGIRISNPTGGQLGDKSTGTGTIVDDDGRPPGTHFDVADAPTATEGQHSVFTVTLSNAPTAPMTVHYNTADATATAGNDYTAASGDLTFAAGETSKTVAVDTAADHEVDPNETFELRLSASSAPSIGQFTGTATIADDVSRPQAEHTLLGTITYRPAFGVGYEGVETLGPFAAPLPPPVVTVTLRNAAGATIAAQALTAKDVVDSPSSPVLYRIDGLAACDACTVVLTTPDGTVQDSAPVSFPATPGQTDADLVYGSQTQGGSVDGTVLAPLGGRASYFSVAILGQAGNVLADSKMTRLSCAPDRGCPDADSYSYHLTGLPSGAVPVRAVLYELATAKPTRFEVDSADFTLDPSGQTRAPDLSGIADPPSAVSGRTLYGQLNFRKPFAPGARRAGDLDIDSRDQDHVTVELRDADGKTVDSLREFVKTRLGYTGYEFHKLAACAGCSVAVLDDKKVAAHGDVTVPAASPSVTRRDLSYSRTGTAEFLAGSVAAGDTGVRKISVAVTDAATGAKLGDSGEGQQACTGATRCPDGGVILYRLAGLPADRDVVLTLSLAGRAIDSRRVTTADPGEVTQAPLLVLPYGKGPRSIQGHVLNAGPFPLGDAAPHWSATTALTARLLDADQHELAHVAVKSGKPAGTDRDDSFFIDNLQPCDDCTLELLRADGSVDDRVPVTVRGDNPSVTVADLGYGSLLGGAYVQGEIVLRRANSPHDMKVQLIDAAGKVIADTDKLKGASNAAGGPGTLGKGMRFAYRLGGVPRNGGQVKVVVLQKRKKLASTNVTVAPGLADTSVPALKVDTEAGGRAR